MAEVKGIKESLELLEGLKVLAVAGKKAFADGKIGYEDLGLLMGLLTEFNKLSAAFSGLDQIVSEAKDLSAEESNQLIAKVLEIVAAYKAA